MYEITMKDNKYVLTYNGMLISESHTKEKLKEIIRSRIKEIEHQIEKYSVSRSQLLDLVGVL